MKPCVYILASRPGGAIYVGMTTNIRQRLETHHAGLVRHTQRYSIKRLVYIEGHETIEDAVIRENRLKTWKRAWKIALIERINPRWRDLSRIPGWLD